MYPGFIIERFKLYFQTVCHAEGNFGTYDAYLWIFASIRLLRIILCVCTYAGA